ncbi:lauroyl acyltransferase [Bifidobacterium dolichotidis]|uniref:Lauroyl acyltransferase n=1 Tax=Bifidobacterium dolichotidis TaxID=2306976 RepID=A0A430FT61_9BIFI|nr:phosphatidylinositol mannoside acyltransferase [Bifidobacterium dolichotidis]RSX56050.1 lauroyl acyltransferase [Bifidobacterium dolichotidis]
MDEIMVWVAQHAKRLPESLVHAVFNCAADVAWMLHGSSVRQLERNLQHVLNSDGGTQKSTINRSTLRKISHQAMRSYFSYFAEAMTVGGRTQEQLQARVRACGSGLEELTSWCKEQGSSAPIAMGHQGNWDYAGLWGSEHVAPVVTVAEKLSNEQLLQVFTSIREQLGIHILLQGSGHVTQQLTDQLQQSSCIVPLLADRDLGRHGEFVEAFGSVIRVARGPAVLALETGLPLYVVNMHRERISGAERRRAHSHWRYVLEVSGPVQVNADLASMDKAQAIHELTQAWVDVWSQAIRRSPADWHMMQPIFLEDLDMTRLSNVPDYIQRLRKAMDL